MAKRKKIKVGECVHCGKIKPLQDDHIPPKNLFAKPRPSNLITVPSCKKCNQGASKDDQYFWTVIGLRDDVGTHPDVKKILPSILKSFSREEQKRFTQNFLSGVQKVNLITPSGIHLGPGWTYDVDLTRLDSVVARTIKGLFYHELGTRLPDNYEATAYSGDGLSRVDNSLKKQLRDWSSSLLTQPPKIVGEEVLIYWYRILDEDPNVSVWLLIFYKQVIFFGMTTPI